MTDCPHCNGKGYIEESFDPDGTHRDDALGEEAGHIDCECTLCRGPELTYGDCSHLTAQYMIVHDWPMAYIINAFPRDFNTLFEVCTD